MYVHKNSSCHREHVADRMEKITNSSVQSKIEENNETDKTNLTSHNNEVSAMQEETSFTCSLYISRAGDLQGQGQTIQGAIYVISSVL